MLAERKWGSCDSVRQVIPVLHPVKTRVQAAAVKPWMRVCHKRGVCLISRSWQGRGRRCSREGRSSTKRLQGAGRRAVERRGSQNSNGALQAHRISPALLSVKGNHRSLVVTAAGTWACRPQGQGSATGQSCPRTLHPSFLQLNL